MGAVPPADPKRVSILFDFDGTIGDTEQPAMEVAFWELAPYFVQSAKGEGLPDMNEFVRDSAGKAFEFMLEVVEEERKEAGLPSIQEVRDAAGEDSEILKTVDANRVKYGLKTIQELRKANALKDILTQQKEETVDALSKIAGPTKGMRETLESLKAMGVPFAISTTSPKPRVPVSVVACKLTDFFPEDKIHSGESDFDPPRFKPDPSVYLKAAEHEGALPPNCVAVEDSASGVGSASNANIGLIVGYVGATHIIPEKKAGHAKDLMAGTRADNGRGAEIVIQDMTDLLPIIRHWLEVRKSGEPLDVNGIAKEFKGTHWVSDKKGPELAGSSYV